MHRMVHPAQHLRGQDAESMRFEAGLVRFEYPGAGADPVAPLVRDGATLFYSTSLP
jgi:hypothetical protein